MFYTYILQSKRDGDLYIGSTRNLRKRFEQHQKGEVFSTKSRRPLILIYYEACLKEDDAHRREKSLKTFRGKMTIRRRLKSFFTGSSNYPQLKIAAARAAALTLIATFSLTSMFSALSFPKEARAAATISKSLSRPVNEIGLVGWWTMDGPDTLTNIADRSGQGNNGNLSGFTSTTTAPGRVGQALNFDGKDDGTGDSVRLPSFSSTAQTYTFSMWTKSGQANDVGKYLFDSETGRLVIGFMTGTVGKIGYFDGAVWHDMANTPNDNSWHHVVFVLNSGNSTGSYYKDGVFVNSDTYTGTNIGGQVRIAGRYDGSNAFYYQGMLDDFRIYNRALSAAEVTRLYQIGATSKISKTLQGRDSLTSGLVGWWTFDGPDTLTNIADKSGQGNNGSLILGASGNTSTTTTPGRVGQALLFDGINDYVTLGASYNGVQTVAFWIQVSTSTTLQKIIDLNGTATVTIDSGTLNGNNFTSPTRYVDGAAASTINDTNWHHVAITTGTGINASAMDIGRISAAYLGGLLDDVRIYNRALSASEILQLYQIGATSKIAKTLPGRDSLTSGLVGHWTFDGPDMLTTVADKSGQGNNGNLIHSGSGTTTAPGKIGQALNFDGVNDYVLTPFNVSTLTNFTISLWEKTDNPNLGTQRFYSADLGGTDRFYFGVNTLSRVVLGLSDWNPTISSSLSSGWEHYVIVLDGTTGYVYRNGSLIASQAGITVSLPNKVLYIGRDEPASTNYFVGKMDDVRIYSRALSQSEITQLYNMGR